MARNMIWYTIWYMMADRSLGSKGGRRAAPDCGMGGDAVSVNVSDVHSHRVGVREPPIFRSCKADLALGFPV